MTTIAYVAGIMAGDTQVEWTGEASGICAGFENKVFKFDGGLIATSGTANQGSDYMKWYIDGQKGECQYSDDDEPLDFFALIVLTDGSMWKCEDGGNLSRQLGKYCAIGSGYSGAMAAMEMGADARMAVAVAMKHDPASGGEITTVELEGETWR